MTASDILNIFKHRVDSQLIDSIQDAGDNTPITVKGTVGSSLALLATETFNQLEEDAIFIFPDRERALFFYHDVEKLLDDEENELAEKQVFFFPASFNRLSNWQEQDVTNVKLRSELVDRIANSPKKSLMITYPEALAEKTISTQFLKKNSFVLKTGEHVPVETFLEFLYEYNYQQESFVFEPGQFAWRGAVFDIFSYSEEYPIRIDLDDETISALRFFDAGSQLSIKDANTVHIMPNPNSQSQKNENVSVFENLAADTKVWLINTKDICTNLTDNYQKIGKNNYDDVDVADYFIQKDDFIKFLPKYKVVEVGSGNLFEEKRIFSFGIQPQHHFAKNFSLFLDELVDNYEHGEKNLFLSENVNQLDRVKSVLDDLLQTYNGKNKSTYKIDDIFIPVETILHEGFRDEVGKLNLYTDHQFFEKYHRFSIRDKYKKSEAFTLNEIYDLQPGDYVVHVDHGIGIYQGLEKIDMNGKDQEAIKLVYKNNDILYISIHSLHKITKYVGKDGTPPALHRLGSGVWERNKERTKRRVKELVFDLVKLYAKRKTQKGFAFSPDNYLQTELEASFQYEDTPDQVKTTNEVKHDMESRNPMERLICGDVGFGKTEIAIRAAFKAVCDSKQVAFLVPTTVLALQHYNTIKERLEKFPCNINYLNRFKTPMEVKKILQEVKEGKIDILIGTHRILSKDVEFKDLGLLVIDEEQKFGVGSKEKLREMKATIDTLTMSATPIPRTLQFSLMGVRDISVITTPPPNRYPIQTEVHVFDEELIKEAITFELGRNGQVFFVNNKVQNIYEVAAMIQGLVPKAKIGVGHGQMDGAQLEKVMMDFISGKFDVLVATTIVESGLDITNANTMIINDAQNYALNVLHQLRGRVGRNNKKAFCYLLVTTENMNENARKRLQAIEDFSDIGSGFQIAMRDLDIRGAGDILGAEQSGFINEMGFEMYQKILSEAILELQDSEIGDEMADNSALVQRECQIETDLGLQIPSDYVSDVSERMSLYKELNTISSDENLEVFRKKLIDIFGELPKEVEELLKIIPLKRIAIYWHIDKIILRNGTLTCHFSGNSNSPFYQSENFTNVLLFLQKNHPRVTMKEVNKVLQMSIQKIYDVDSAIHWLEKINK